MISYKQLKQIPAVIAGLLFSLAALADHHGEASNLSSIKRIHAGNFGFDQAEVDTIKRAMQAAIDGGHIPGALLLVGNSQGVGLLETAGMQGPDSTTPVNKDSIFRIYSMTNPLSALPS